MLTPGHFLLRLWKGHTPVTLKRLLFNLQLTTPLHMHTCEPKTFTLSKGWKWAFSVGNRNKNTALSPVSGVQTLPVSNYPIWFQQQTVFQTHTVFEASADWIIQASKGAPPCHCLSCSHTNTPHCEDSLITPISRSLKIVYVLCGHAAGHCQCWFEVDRINLMWLSNVLV